MEGERCSRRARGDRVQSRGTDTPGAEESLGLRIRRIPGPEKNLDRVEDLAWRRAGGHWGSRAQVDSVTQ